MRAWVAVCLCVLAACSGAEEEDAGRAELSIVASIQPDGRTELLTLPLGGDTAGKTLAITAEFDQTCFGSCCAQLEDVRADQTDWIPAAKDQSEWGKSCHACSQRAYVGPSAGFFVFPNNGSDLPAIDKLHLRVSVRDCRTGLPRKSAFQEALPGSVHVSWQVTEPPVGPAVLPIRFFHAAEASLPAVGLPAIVTMVNACFAPAKVVLQTAASSLQLPEVPNRVQFKLGRVDDLLALQKAARLMAPSQSPRVDVIFVPCLVTDLYGMGEAHDVGGVVPRIPGGVHPDAVFVATRNCYGDKLGPSRFPWPGAMALTVAHELGHYLGLYHTVGGVDYADHLADTTSDNLMNPYPYSVASSCAVTKMQAHVIRHHPSVRALK